MTLVLSLPDRNVNLGPTFPALAAFARMGRLEPGDEFPQLMAVATAQGEVDGPTAVLIRRQAAEFLTRHASALDGHARWILEQLAGPP